MHEAACDQLIFVGDAVLHREPNGLQARSGRALRGWLLALLNQRIPAATWRRRRGQNVMVDQRAIGRFLGNGIRPVMGRSSAKADARVLGALLKIASAAFW